MKEIKLGKLNAITIFILLISLMIYEVIFYNGNNIIQDQYNFSVFRMIVYIAIVLLYIKFSKKFIEEAEKTLKSKKKIIILFLIASLIYTIYICMKKTNIYRILLLVIAELQGLLFILYVTKDYIKNIIITTLTFGCVFSLANDTFHIMDEKLHFITALNVANGNLNYVENPMEDKAFRDILQFTPLHEIILEYGNTKYEMNMEPILEDETDTTIRVTTYSPIFYIPSAIGINIARLFGGSLVDVILSGRIANLIVFSIMLIIIFKLLSFKKDTFYCLYLLPQALALSASYSMDGLTVGVVGIFIAYVLKLYKQNEGVIKLKQYVTLLLLFVISLLSKSGVYLGICVIVFILPIIKNIRQNKKILIVLLLLLILAGVLGLYRFNDLANSTEGDPRVKSANPKEQIRFLLSDYTNIITVYSNCMQGTLFNLEYYEGFNLQEFTGDIYRIVGFVLIIFILYTAITDGSYTFKKKEKALMCLAFGATFLIATFALYLFYTPVRVLTVLGYQARYLIPILPLVLIGINSKKIDTKYNEEETYSKMAMSLGILTFVDIISKIIFVLE